MVYVYEMFKINVHVVSIITVMHHRKKGRKDPGSPRADNDPHAAKSFSTSMSLGKYEAVATTPPFRLTSYSLGGKMVS